MFKKNLPRNCTVAQVLAIVIRDRLDIKKNKLVNFGPLTKKL